MTQSEFLQECLKATVTPELALENDKIVAALKKRDDKEVRRLLATEF